MNYNWYDFIGNVGVFLILLSYLLLQINKIKNNSLFYNLTNGLGAALILVSLYFEFNLSAFIIESFWLAFSLIGIVKYFKSQKQRG